MPSFNSKSPYTRQYRFRISRAKLYRPSLRSETFAYLRTQSKHRNPQNYFSQTFWLLVSLFRALLFVSSFFFFVLRKSRTTLGEIHAIVYGYPRINVFSSIYLSPLSPSSRSERVPLFLSLPQSLPLSSSPTAFRLGGQNQKPGRDVRIVARASITICEGRQGGKLRARRRGWRRKKNKKKQQRSARRKWTRGGRKEGVALSPPAPGGAAPSAPEEGACALALLGAPA